MLALLSQREGVPSFEDWRKALKARTSQFAANVLPRIREVQAAGHTSLNAIAGQLVVAQPVAGNEAACGAGW